MTLRRAVIRPIVDSRVSIISAIRNSIFSNILIVDA